jgi:phosphate transport system substrate-binding protein
LLLPPTPVVEQGIVRIAGSGAAIPLLSRLAQAWSASHPSPRIVVEPSVGSTGGVRAVSEMAIDLGVVARPLKPSEAGPALVVIPLARDAVVLAGHPALPIDDISSSFLVDLMTGTRTAFEDGSHAAFLLRDRDDTAHSALEQVVPGLRTPREQAHATRRFPVLRHDDAMGIALSATPGAIGPFSLGAILSEHLPLRVLAIDGVRPTTEGVKTGAWKASRDLSFVVRRDRIERSASFLAFARSDEGAKVIGDSGYVPVEDAP